MQKKKVGRVKLFFFGKGFIFFDEMGYFSRLIINFGGEFLIALVDGV